MRAFLLLTSFVFILCSSPLRAEKSVEMLQDFLNNTKSMQAGFQQKLFDPRGALLQQSVGKFTLSRPGKFIWDYVLPYPQKIISNGKKIWIYDSELEQVIIKPYQQMLSGTPVLLLENDADLAKDFQLVDLGYEHNQYWLSLIPKSEDKAFKEIIVGMTADGLQTMKLIDGFEQTTVIEFEQLIINPKLSNDIFNFIVPQGMDVIGG